MWWLIILVLLVVRDALGQTISPSTPVLQLRPPTRQASTCSSLSVSWLTRIPAGTNTGSTLFTLELIPVEHGDATPSVDVPGPPLTSPSLISTAGSATPGRRTRDVSRDALTLHTGVLVMQGLFTETKLAAPAGWYILRGSQPTPADTGLVILDSQPFMVTEGDTGTTCLANTANNASQTASTTSTTQSTTSSAGTRRSIHAELIAGIVIGAFALTALAMGLLWLLCRRRRQVQLQHQGEAPLDDETDSVHAWRETRAAQWRMLSGSGVGATLAADATPSAIGQDDEKSVQQTEEERAVLAARLADMLRQAGIKEGLGAQHSKALRARQFEPPGLDNEDLPEVARITSV